METKICTKCGDEKAIDMFGKQAKGKNGLRSECKNCNVQRSAKYAKDNRGKIRSKDRLFYAKNKEKINEIARIWRRKNREKLSPAEKKWRFENNEKVLEFKKNYRVKNKEKIFESRIKSIDELSESYVKEVLKATGFTTEQIKENPELIEVKRLIIKTKRLCKTSQN